MSSLKERLEQYEQQPDERVWNRIAETMHAKARRRRLTTAGIGAGIVAAAAIIALVTLRSTPTEPGSESRQQLTAATETQTLHTTAEAVVAASENENMNMEREERPTPTTEVTVAPQASDNNAEETADATGVLNTNRTTETTTREERTVAPTVTTPREHETPTTNYKPTQNNATTQNTGETKTNKQNTPAPKVQKSGTDSLVVWIPNAFSPDDPVNDNVRVFKVFPNNNASILSYEIYIYSRTGRQVYHSRDINAGWDGTANGHAMPMGAYVYIIELNDAVHGLQHKKGTVTLIR